MSRIPYKRIILEALVNSTMFTLEELINFCLPMMLPYHESYREIKRQLRGDYRNCIKLPRLSDLSDSIPIFSKNTFRKTLSELKREGLIQSPKRGIWQIGNKGKEYLKFISEKIGKRYYSKPKEKTKEFKLIVFDIPEFQRRKRDWLRKQLVEFDFKPLQKSVWIGKVSLPDEFIKDLEGLKLLPFVHILSIKQQGTLSNYFA